MTELDALQGALAAEHAAVYGYGVVAALLDGSQLRVAEAALDHHRARRDRLRASVVDAGGVPVESAAAYTLPADFRAVGGAARLARHIETEVGMTFAALVAASTGDARAFAARALADTAVRAARWSGSAARYPGLREDPEPAAQAGTATPTPG